jgi:hypothetical protein
MKEISEILKYTLPSLVVFATAYFLIKNFLINELKVRKSIVEADFRIKQQFFNKDDKGEITAIRLQAYERVVLFLERISPNSLIFRTYQKDMTAKQFHVALIQTIREEFEHNLSQQIYISSKSWELIKKAKEEMTKLINEVASKLDDKAAGKDLSQTILQTTVKTEKLPNSIAISYIKNEIQQSFYTK